MRKTPSNFVDITGKQFNHWSVLYRTANKGNRVHYMCKCSCGIIKSVRKLDLERGNSKSCGHVCKPKLLRNKPNFAKPYTKEEKELIRTVYPESGSYFLSVKLGRSEEAIRRKAYSLGVKCGTTKYLKRRHGAWKSWEIETLKKYYPKGGIGACLKHLPKRTKNAIWVRASQLGLKVSVPTRYRNSDHGKDRRGRAINRNTNITTERKEHAKRNA